MSAPFRVQNVDPWNTNYKIVQNSVTQTIENNRICIK